MIMNMLGHVQTLWRNSKDDVIWIPLDLSVSDWPLSVPRQANSGRYSTRGEILIVVYFHMYFMMGI